MDVQQEVKKNQSLCLGECSFNQQPRFSINYRKKQPSESTDQMMILQRECKLWNQLMEPIVNDFEELQQDQMVKMFVQVKLSNLTQTIRTKPLKTNLKGVQRLNQQSGKFSNNPKGKKIKLQEKIGIKIQLKQQSTLKIELKEELNQCLDSFNHNSIFESQLNRNMQSESENIDNIWKF